MAQAIAQGRAADAESSNNSGGGSGRLRRAGAKPAVTQLSRSQGAGSAVRRPQAAGGLQDYWSMQRPHRHLSICSIKSELLCFSRLDFQTGPLLKCLHNAVCLNCLGPKVALWWSLKPCLWLSALPTSIFAMPQASRCTTSEQGPDLAASQPSTRSSLRMSGMQQACAAWVEGSRPARV